MKKYLDNIEDDKTAKLLSLNALFAEKVTFEFDTLVVPNKQDAAFCTVFHNANFDTVPFNKHISRFITKEITLSNG